MHGAVGASVCVQGYGFITFSNPQAAEQAMLMFNNYPLGGGAIHVAYSTSATAKARQQALRQVRRSWVSSVLNCYHPVICNDSGCRISRYCTLQNLDLRTAWTGSVVLDMLKLVGTRRCRFYVKRLGQDLWILWLLTVTCV